MTRIGTVFAVVLTAAVSFAARQAPLIPGPMAAPVTRIGGWQSRQATKVRGALPAATRGKGKTQSSKITGLPSASALKFDAGNSEIQQFAKTLAQQNGWNGDYQVGLLRDQTFVRYTTDHWATSHDVPFTYLYNNSGGFLFPNLPKGTSIEYAIHAQVGLSNDGFQHFEKTGEVWVNHGGFGKNFSGATTDATGN